MDAMDATTYASYGLAIIGLCLCLMLASLLIWSALALLGEQRKERALAKDNKWMERRKKYGLK